IGTVHRNRDREDLGPVLLDEADDAPPPLPAGRAVGVEDDVAGARAGQLLGGNEHAVATGQQGVPRGSPFVRDHRRFLDPPAGLQNRAWPHPRAGTPAVWHSPARPRWSSSSWSTSGAESRRPTS